MFVMLNSYIYFNGMVANFMTCFFTNENKRIRIFLQPRFLCLVTGVLHRFVILSGYEPSNRQRDKMLTSKSNMVAKVLYSRMIQNWALSPNFFSDILLIINKQKNFTTVSIFIILIRTCLIIVCSTCSDILFLP